ncbi:hypothetical protein [Rothia halotolerans]|uniref:hypothetical protein n=1 Tax=Rothia halotolerans TaxID=405770 RepID=UPI00101B78D1|nr:hypothetical protein [Rothia halotolerans]
MKSYARKNVKRAGATAAIAAALLTATGCGYIHDQPTKISYDASDGVSASVGDVEANNLLVVTNAAQDEGRLLGGMVNNGERDASVEIDTGEATVQVRVPADSEVDLSEQEALVDPAGAEPGALLFGTELKSEGATTSIDMPVLDGALEQYAPFVPGGSDYTPPAKPTAEH